MIDERARRLLRTTAMTTAPEHRITSVAQLRALVGDPSPVTARGVEAAMRAAGSAEAASPRVTRTPPGRISSSNPSAPEASRSSPCRTN